MASSIKPASVRLFTVFALAVTGSALFAQSTTPAAATTSPAPAPAAVTNPVVSLDPFVVDAYTDVRDRSIEDKRQAPGIADFLSTDQLGQFITTNIGSVVNQLPGVYISGAGQSGGDAISVRGFGGDFNSLQVDGQRLPSNQGASRAVSVDNIPTALIGSISVYKSPLPSMDADSIGGLVNIQTKSGLDLQRSLFSARASYGEASYGNGYEDHASVTYSGRLSPKVGIFLSATRSQNRELRDQIYMDPGDYIIYQLATMDPSLPKLSASNTTPLFSFGRVSERRTIQSQQLTGVNLNFDFQVSPTWRVSLRTFHTEEAEQRPQIRNEWRFDRSAGTDPIGKKSTDTDYVYFDQSTGNMYFSPEQRIIRYIADQNEIEKIGNYQLAGSHHWTDSSLDYSVSYGRSTRDMANDMFYFQTDNVQLKVNTRNPLGPVFSTIQPDDFFYNSHKHAVAPNFDDPSFYSPTSKDGYFSPNQRRAEVIKAYDDVYNYTVNYSKWIGGTKVQAGAALRTEDKVNGRDYVIGNTFNYNPAQTSYQDVNGFYNGLQPLGLYPTYSSLRAQNTMSPQDFAAYILANNPSSDNLRDSTIQDINASEDILALYAQASHKYFDDKLTVLGGVRWEQTKGDYKGFTADVTGIPSIDAPRPVTDSITYSGIYPSLHFIYKVTDNSLLRFAVGRTLSRPSFQDLTPSSYAYTSVDSTTGDTRITVQRGNADLKPTQSTNVDLSYEYYFKQGGLFSIAPFYKRLTNWIYDSALIAPPSQFPQYAAVPNLTQVEEDSSFNGSLAKVYGVEFNLQKTLGWGFSVGANYTTMHFNVNAQETGLHTVPGQADRVARLFLTYEARRVSVRLEFVNNGDILDTKYSFSDPSAVAYFKGRGLGVITHDVNGNEIVNLGEYDISGNAMTATVQYRISKNLRLVLEASHLLHDYNRSLLGNLIDFPTQEEYPSWIGTVGLRFSL